MHHIRTTDNADVLTLTSQAGLFRAKIGTVRIYAPNHPAAKIDDYFQGGSTSFADDATVRCLI
jgi:hypothetical protein